MAGKVNATGEIVPFEAKQIEWSVFFEGMTVSGSSRESIEAEP
ncbi:hypothetical protein [Roseivivax lentus]|nr:hypothetical protein [Roseivivax lentus]